MRVCINCRNELKDNETRCPACFTENPLTDEEYEYTDYLKPGTTLKNGKYQIIEKIGQDGFGITYLALDTKNNKKVVIKELFISDYCRRSQTNQATIIFSNNQAKLKFQKAKEKAKEEAKVLSIINHKNIVRAYEDFEDNNTFYIVLEYIEGKSLERYIKEKGKLKEDEVLEIVKQLLNG